MARIHSRVPASLEGTSGRRRITVPFDSIDPDPNRVPHPRATVDNVDALALFIAENGLSRPLLAWSVGEELLLLDGWRHFMALEKIQRVKPQLFGNNFEEVEVEVVEGSLQDALVAMAEANVRDGSWDEAELIRACGTLQHEGLSIREVARTLSRGDEEVSDLCEIASKAVPELISAISDNYPLSEAQRLAQNPPDLQVFAMEQFRIGLHVKEGSPKRKQSQRKPKRPKTESLGVARRTLGDLEGALDKVEAKIEDHVNENAKISRMPPADLKIIERLGVANWEYYLERLGRLQGIRHGLLWARGVEYRPTEIEETPGLFWVPRGGRFQMPCWRDRKVRRRR